MLCGELGQPSACGDRWPALSLPKGAVALGAVPSCGLHRRQYVGWPQRGSAFLHDRETAEQRIKEGQVRLELAPTVLPRFVANRVRLQMFILAYNLENLLRRVYPPKAQSTGRWAVSRSI